MVDVNKLKSRMVLAGHTQRTLVAALRDAGLPMTENTFSAKMNGKSQFYVEDAQAICRILGIEKADEKAEIFLA